MKHVTGNVEVPSERNLPSLSAGQRSGSADIQPTIAVNNAGAVADEPSNPSKRPRGPSDPIEPSSHATQMTIGPDSDRVGAAAAGDDVGIVNPSQPTRESGVEPVERTIIREDTDSGTEDSPIHVPIYPGITEIPFALIASSSSAGGRPSLATGARDDDVEQTLEVVEKEPEVEETPEVFGKYVLYRAVDADLHGIKWGGELFIKADVPFLNVPLMIGTPVKLSGYQEQLRFVAVLLRKADKSVEYLVWVPVKNRQDNWKRNRPAHVMRAIRGRAIDWEATGKLLSTEAEVDVKTRSSICALLKKNIVDTKGITPAGLKSQLEKLKLTLLASGEGKSPFLAPTTDKRVPKEVERLSIDDLPSRNPRHPRPSEPAASKDKSEHPKARSKKAELFKQLKSTDKPKSTRSDALDDHDMDSDDWRTVLSEHSEGDTSPRKPRVQAQPKTIYYPPPPQIPSNSIPMVSSDAMEAVRRSFEDTVRELRYELRRQHDEVMAAVAAIQRTASATTTELKSVVAQEASTVLTHSLQSFEERVGEKIERAIKDDTRVSMSALNQIISLFGGPRVPIGPQTAGQYAYQTPRS